MSRMKRSDKSDIAANNALDRARQAAAWVKPVADRVKPIAAQVKPVADRVKPVAAQVKPVARSTGAAARRGVHRTRAWAAPQVEHTGHVLQDSVAPKVSALLSSAAQRIEPAKPPRRRWRKLAGISMLAAAASAVAALILNRKKPDFTTSAAEADADDVTPAPEMRDGQGTSTDAEASATADVNGQVRTP
jgi:hypothetical protein